MVSNDSMVSTSSPVEVSIWPISSAVSGMAMYSLSQLYDMVIGNVTCAHALVMG